MSFHAVENSKRPCKLRCPDFIRGPRFLYWGTEEAAKFDFLGHGRKDMRKAHALHKSGEGGRGRVRRYEEELFDT